MLSLYMGLFIPSQFITLWKMWNCSTLSSSFVFVKQSFSHTMNGISNCCFGARFFGRPCMNTSFSPRDSPWSETKIMQQRLSVTCFNVSMTECTR